MFHHINLLFFVAIYACTAGCTPTNQSTGYNTPATNNGSNTMDGEPLNNQTSDTQTITGVITHHREGVVIDAANRMLLETDSGESIDILVMEAGMGMMLPGHGEVCNKNRKANDVFRTLTVGDRVTVYGKSAGENQVEVCSSEQYWIKKL